LYPIELRMRWKDGGRPMNLDCRDLRQYAENCWRWQAGQIDFHLLSFRAWSGRLVFGFAMRVSAFSVGRRLWFCFECVVWFWGWM
ncbi:MAG: hypothetical protein ABJM55_30090, partial [Rhodopirellula bahusiensis]